MLALPPFALPALEPGSPAPASVPACDVLPPLACEPACAGALPPLLAVPATSPVAPPDAMPVMLVPGVSPALSRLGKLASRNKASPLVLHAAASVEATKNRLASLAFAIG
jgi:hypothetical protein